MPIGIPTVCWYAMPSNYTHIFSKRKVKAKLSASPTFIRVILLEKKPALSEGQRYVFDSLLKHHLTRDNTSSLWWLICAISSFRYFAAT